MIFNTLLVLLFYLFVPIDTDHGIYISVFEIKHQEGQGKGAITIKSFSDDLANALRSMNFNISEDNNPCVEEDAVMAYIEAHFSLRINDSDIYLELVSCTRQNDTHWLELSYVYKDDIKKVKVSSDWLTELFVNQQNIIKINNGTVKKNLRLSKAFTSEVIQF